MSTQSQYLITAVIDGTPTEAWDTLSGGETTAEITKRRPGGTTKEKSYASRPTTGAVTIGRGYERERDIALGRRLRARVGRARVVITEQPLDDDGLPWGKPTIYIGRLASINTGDVDSNSDEPRECELVAEIEEVA
ncbi:MAG TPA: hypothetical protein VMF51_18270 [Nocardioides sp.]|uniref:hypothetical protein n=1 Tax=Nocardioides sp. TaxID=35761 RepID=UPI002CFBAD1E|nr:hypothetical protein [Nocardioides sp.]HTW17082.1 hypothetical protein [Nocardioides sp.]